MRRRKNTEASGGHGRRPVDYYRRRLDSAPPSYMSTTAELNFCRDIDIPAESPALSSGRVENNQVQSSKAKSGHSTRPKPLHTRSDGTSASRTTGFARDTAPAATSDPVRRRNRRNSTPTVPDTGRAGDDQANELVDISRNLTLISHRMEALEMKITSDAGRRDRPQVKITPWRVLNTVFIVAAGVYKAAATYLGQTTGPTTADWIVGVVWALMYLSASTCLVELMTAAILESAYWVTFFEDLEVDAARGHSSWFLTFDLSGVLYHFFPVLFAPFIIFGTAVLAVTSPIPVEVVFVTSLSVGLGTAATAFGVHMLLPKVRKLLDKMQSPHFLHGVFDFHGVFDTSDWLVNPDHKLFLFLFVAGAVQVGVSLVSDPRKTWWPNPLPSDDIAMKILCSASLAGVLTASVMTRGRSSS
ncbi:hypothetical protein B0H11DRAFT_1960501 [Mycena galericulata]|nr:hypothetical protein B0H11DRAFT_1960501 [Mycena galericulata]